MQSVSTNHLFMHRHEKWGASNIACPSTRKREGAISPFAPAVPRSMFVVIIYLPTPNMGKIAWRKLSVMVPEQQCINCINANSFPVVRIKTWIKL